MLGWFSAAVPGAQTDAVVAIASTQRGNRLFFEVIDGLQGAGFRFFEIGSLIDAVPDYAARLDLGWLGLARGQRGIAAKLPECSTAAVGWLIAQVFNVVLSLESPSQALSIRVTRSALE